MGCLSYWSFSPIHTQKKITTLYEAFLLHTSSSSYTILLQYFFSTSSNQTRPDQPNHMATAKPQGSQLWSDDDLAFENETWNLRMIVTGDNRKHLSLSSGFTYITQALQDSCLVCRGLNQISLSRPWRTKLGETFAFAHVCRRVSRFNYLSTLWQTKSETFSYNFIEEKRANRTRRDRAHPLFSWPDPPTITHIINGELGRVRDYINIESLFRIWPSQTLRIIRYHAIIWLQSHSSARWFSALCRITYHDTTHKTGTC